MNPNLSWKRDPSAREELGSTIVVEKAASDSDLSILVVEDDDICRTVVRNTLRHAGFDVICARNVSEAIEHVENGARIDVAPVDVVMPLGTPHGFFFVQTAKQHYPALKIIFMSACVTAEGCALFDPSEAFLSKPFAPLHLLEAIAHIAS